VIVELPERYPGCGILVAGSVQRDEERSDSSLDLFVVFPGGGDARLGHEESAEGVKIDLALFPERGFQREVAEHGYRFWMFARAQIVHDLTGIAKRNQEIALAYFRRHPDADAAWTEQMAEGRAGKAGIAAFFRRKVEGVDLHQEGPPAHLLAGDEGLAPADRGLNRPHGQVYGLATESTALYTACKIASETSEGKAATEAAKCSNRVPSGRPSCQTSPLATTSKGFLHTGQRVTPSRRQGREAHQGGRPGTAGT